jgi:hypothetical protein
VCEYAHSFLPCDDGDACTTGDVCNASDVCAPTGTADCNDGEACTEDLCNPASGCYHVNHDEYACTDGSACTNDVCSAGDCVSTNVTCDDANACTTDTCNPASGCVFTPDDSNICSDGSACTNDECSSGTCVSTAITCNDGNPCTLNNCNPASGCVYPPDPAGTCTDGSACTTDVCSAGSCVSTAITCNDGNSCTLNNCNPASGCVYPPDPAGACTDGLMCTTDVCSAGSCVSTAITCNDGNLCTNDSCNPANGACVFAPNSVACNDGNVCTTGDVCSGGSCVGGAALPCDDGLVCTTNSCNPASGCAYTPIANCCVDTVGPASDCTPAMGGCSSTLTTISAGGCAESRCSPATHTCSCYMSPVNTPCTAFDPGDWPSNCYSGFCGNWTTMTPTGICSGKPTGVAAPNNLCSDLWSTNTVLNTTNIGYLGQFPNSVGSANFTKTGSTRCGYDNYQAIGEDCTEKDLFSNLGSVSKDVVYVFEYQTSTATQFNLYSYVVTVQADFDVAVYVKDDIDTAGACPEGFNPGLDTSETPGWTVDGARCQFPYNDGDGAPPYVSEDECNESGNITKGQQCCDGCLDWDCGYKWCTRGYDAAGTACNQCVPGDCDSLWTYPQDPINCDPSLPAPIGYSDYTEEASAVIFPDGKTDSSWRKVFIFIDGEGADATLGGNFYLTVEKRLWFASPCDRVNDDPRVYDVTNVGTAGQTFLGTLQNAVNSGHSAAGPCAGYSCDDADWSGGTTCHSITGSGNMFWPAAVNFKIDREWGTGGATYCFTTDESITGPADVVFTYYKRSNPDAPSICDESYSYALNWCKHNNYGSNARLQLSVAEGDFWLVDLSEYAYRNKPCVPGIDNCNFKLTVTEGACPVTCVSPPGGSAGSFTMNTSSYDGVIGAGTVTTGSGNDYHPGGDGYDHTWLVYNNLGVPTDVEFKLIPTGDAVLAVYDCALNLLGYADNAWFAGGTETLTINVPAGANPLHIDADSYNGSAIGAYTLRAKWGTPPAPSCDLSWWSGGIEGTVTVGGSGSTMVSGTTADSTNHYDPTPAGSSWNGPDEVWQINLATPDTVTFSLCGGATWDTQIALIACDAYVETTSDDFCSSQSQITWALVSTYAPYFLVIDGWGGASGAYTATISW